MLLLTIHVRCCMNTSMQISTLFVRHGVKKGILLVILAQRGAVIRDGRRRERGEAVARGRGKGGIDRVSQCCARASPPLAFRQGRSTPSPNLPTYCNFKLNCTRLSGLSMRPNFQLREFFILKFSPFYHHKCLAYLPHTNMILPTVYLWLHQPKK